MLCRTKMKVLNTEIIQQAVFIAWLIQHRTLLWAQIVTYRDPIEEQFLTFN